jgi:hypothetical protein
MAGAGINVSACFTQAAVDVTFSKLFSLQYQGKEIKTSVQVSEIYFNQKTA